MQMCVCAGCTPRRFIFASHLNSRCIVIIINLHYFRTLPSFLYVSMNGKENRKKESDLCCNRSGSYPRVLPGFKKYFNKCSGIARNYCNFLCYRLDKMSDRKAVIKNADMSEEMQQDAVDCATQALEKYNIEKVFYSLIHIDALNNMFPEYIQCKE